MFMAPAEQRQQEQLFHMTAMWDKSMGNAQPHLPVPSPPPQPDLTTFLATEFPVEEGRRYTAKGYLCPSSWLHKTSRDYEHGSTAPGAWFWKGIYHMQRWGTAQVTRPNSLQQGTHHTVLPEETRSEPCRTDPIIHLVQTPSHRHQVQVSLVGLPRLLENRSAWGKLHA